MEGRKGESAKALDRSPLFLVLEGGGAKGIAHVAAWGALEAALENAAKNHPDRKQYELRELAGTSAGAMAAALIAAGARADQLIDEEGRMPLAGELKIEWFYDLFGIAGWRRLQFWRFLLKPSKAMENVASRITGDDRQKTKRVHTVLWTATANRLGPPWPIY
jgi:predicted acylesterase/phospholipase RssA